MFFEKRFLKAIDQIRAQVAVPLRIELWNGRQFDFCSDPSVTVTIPSSWALRYFISPNLNKLGEAFVEGHIRVEGSSKNVFKVAEGLARSVTARLPAVFQRVTHHSRDRDREAIQYHYDVANDFYALFLDRGMVYSCAYYRHDSDTLEAAQSQKLDHILNKLMLKPGEKFLDIGCGWGALVIRAAQKYGAIATGITLSQNQFDSAQEQIQRAGLGDRCRVLLCDYRDLKEADAYDKIASVGMFEHVGLKNLPVYFQAIHRLLKEDGLVLNHGITTSDVESRWLGMGAGEFIDRYVFPHGELPHVSLALKEMASAGLEVVDVESLRRHYARTCEAWSNNLESRRDEAVGIVGERRYRIWQIYLAGCAYGFSHGWMNLYQVLCSKAENSELRQQPLTRDYMYGGPP
ncbi:class I SAM-dependent methyltransferase [Rhodoferax sp. UBA5149]|uniref:class I SAM-dependent methyltransferase n=1 Tax=Rhodoferax sp. UBA5149 TaxID=1947379 RepID=UPI0025D5E1C1|nr:class I SAM-dependent methyltransferase [Rhodoferax sp. UBA5149]